MAPRRPARRPVRDHNKKGIERHPFLNTSILVFATVTFLSLVSHASTPTKAQSSSPTHANYKTAYTTHANYPGYETAYMTLGVDPMATSSEITDAWRRRSEETHPDKVGHEDFEEYYSVQTAYSNLYIDHQRCSYDHIHKINGTWADRYQECTNLLIQHHRARSAQEAEKKRAYEEEARKEQEASEACTSGEPLCEEDQEESSGEVPHENATFEEGGQRAEQDVVGGTESRTNETPPHLVSFAPRDFSLGFTVGGLAARPSIVVRAVELFNRALVVILRNWVRL
ncbi:Chaperone protein DnaJ [Cytospora mali]|uniref:Chaperone protein DnaJ n=1 Tax=Cytospora mali TaxID=578113 RepID=A0A194W4M5_CYTMA|nr:Chaperone protein DnaJ [Valsa mali]